MSVVISPWLYACIALYKAIVKRIVNNDGRDFKADVIYTKAT